LSLIKSQWTEIRDCIIETFKLIRLLGLNDQSLRAKNAVIPIAYYLHKKTHKGQPLFRTINNLAYNRNERIEIGRWLHMALLKGVFGGQADGMLTKIRKIISSHLDAECFPLPQIVEEYMGTNKDLRFDDEYISNLLNTQYGDSRCRSILALIFPEMNENYVLHIDHLHPKDAFKAENLREEDFLADNPELLAFYEDPMHWNTIPNLHLLNSSQNYSKNDSNLREWLMNDNNGFRQEDLLIDSSVSLEFDQVRTFLKKRRNALMNRLRRKLYVSEEPLASEEGIVVDEEDSVE